MDQEREDRPTHDQADKESLGVHLAEARKAAGLTQEWAATELSLVKQTISSWEKGRNVPDALQLRRLAKLYETTIDGLVGNAPMLSQKAMRFAYQYDQLDEVLRADFEAMWSTHLERMKARAAGLELSPPKPQTVLLSGTKQAKKRKAA